jgi:hypothetical protein
VTALQVPILDTVRVELPSPHSLKLKGTITAKEPAQDLENFLRLLHRDATEKKATDVLVDVSELTFVNSSAIRLFVDWASWLKNETGHRYTLHFRTSNKITWQRTSFTAITALMKDVLKVERID